MKRRKGLACTMTVDTDHSSRGELKGDVYNIFPYIKDPKHIDEGKASAYTLLGIIDGIFLPIRHRDELQRIASIANHESGHWILGSAMVACEERALAAKLLGMVWNALIDADDDIQLLIPSFTIVGPARKVFDLQKLAERLEKLFEARHVVHEIVARVLQIGWNDWDRNKAKGLIRQVVGVDLLNEKALGTFLNVFERFGPMAVCTIGHYALNATKLTQRSALARLKRATKVARTYKPKDRQDTGTMARLLGYLEFVQHLDSSLPDYNMARCPLAGFCLPKSLDSWAESLTNQSEAEGNPVPSFGERLAATAYRQSAFRMRESRCEREEQLAQGNEILPDSVQEILRWFDPEAFYSLLGYEMNYPTDRALTSLSLIEHDNCDYKYTIGITHGEKDRPLIEISPGMFGLVMSEASLQQMMCGEGPLCLCYPHQPANCPYRALLQRVWDCTQPDPEWENNWKLPNKKPRCIE